MKRQWILAGAVAALLAGATAGAQAQTSSGMSKMSMSGTIDYSVLNSRFYDYTDLIQAKARGYNEAQIATMAKIADKSGMSFQEINRAVQRGETFGMIAGMYNLRLSDVLDSSDYADKIAAYKAAYESTGSMAMKKSDMMMK